MKLGKNISESVSAKNNNELSKDIILYDIMVVDKIDKIARLNL